MFDTNESIRPGVCEFIRRDGKNNKKGYHTWKIKYGDRPVLAVYAVDHKSMMTCVYGDRQILEQDNGVLIARLCMHLVNSRVDGFSSLDDDELPAVVADFLSLADSCAQAEPVPSDQMKLLYEAFGE